MSTLQQAGPGVAPAAERVLPAAGLGVAELPTPVVSRRVALAGACPAAGEDRAGEAATRAATERWHCRVCRGCAVMPECRELALRIGAREPAHDDLAGLAPWESSAPRRYRCAAEAVAS